MKKYVLSRMAVRPGRPRKWRQAFAAVLRAAMIEPHQVEITHQQIIVEKLPVEFHGFRIVQISDIHHSPFLDEERINEAVRMANDLQPDLVALTGDYISHSRDYIPTCARALGKLRAEHGVFAVLGNHDHWTDGEMMRDALVDHGVRVLCNESARIEKGVSYITLAGVDDMMVKRDDLRKALEETSWEETRILLSHNPAIIREAARAGIDLVLSGHTHGGQINWRLLIGRKDRKTARWLRRPSRRLTRGHAQLGSTQLYVNRGLGTVVVPLRYGCTPEITILELLKL